MDRRSFLKATGVGIGVALAPNLLTLQSVQAATVSTSLWIPPKLSGKVFDLELSKGTKQIAKGALTNTYGYNGTGFWGPTLFMKKGDDVSLNVTNNLSEPTTTH